MFSEDFDTVLLFGTDMMITEIYDTFFVYVSLKDTMTILNSVTRKNAIHKSCISRNDSPKGLKAMEKRAYRKLIRKITRTCRSLSAAHC